MADAAHRTTPFSDDTDDDLTDDDITDDGDDDPETDRNAGTGLAGATATVVGGDPDNQSAQPTSTTTTPGTRRAGGPYPHDERRDERRAECSNTVTSLRLEPVSPTRTTLGTDNPCEERRAPTCGRSRTTTGLWTESGPCGARHGERGSAPRGGDRRTHD